MIFSIAMDAENSFYVKFMATEAPTFSGYIISVLAMVQAQVNFFIDKINYKFKNLYLLFIFVKPIK